MRLSRWRIFVLGGPAGTVLLLIACLVVARLTHVDLRWAANRSWGGIALFYLTLVNALIAVQCAIPMRIRGFYNDAAMVALTLINPAFARKIAVFNTITTRALGGVRARDWPADTMKEMAASRDGSSMDVVADLLAYYWHLDSGRAQKANEHLEAAHVAANQKKRVFAAATKSVIELESSYCAAFIEHDAVKARTILDQAGQAPPLAEPVKLRAEAATLLAEGRYDLAGETADRAVAAIRKLYPVIRPSNEADIELCGAIREAAIAKSNPPEPTSPAYIEAP
jgi:hypothetical protein